MLHTVVVEVKVDLEMLAEHDTLIVEVMR